MERACGRCGRGPRLKKNLKKFDVLSCAFWCMDVKVFSQISVGSTKEKHAVELELYIRYLSNICQLFREFRAVFVVGSISVATGGAVAPQPSGESVLRLA